MSNIRIYIGFLFFLLIGLFVYSHFTPFPSNQNNLSADYKPQRIICAAPSVTEIVYALGLGDKVIGISEFTTFPKEAMQKESIGGLVNPNLERIAALHPDIIIMQGQIRKLTDYCEHKGIHAVTVFMRNLPAIFEDIRTIGKALGEAGKADALVLTLREQLNEVKKRTLSTNREDVFVCISRKRDSLINILTTGKNTFLTELIDIAGGKNIFDDLETDYPQISKESFIVRAPKVILDLQPTYNPTEEKHKEMVKDWQEMPLIPAVASGRVYLVTDDSILIPGPRLGEAAKRLFDYIHDVTTDASKTD